jgi:DNA repair protein RecO
LPRWSYATLFTEIISEMVPENVCQEEVFVLLEASLSQLEIDRDPLNVMDLALLCLFDRLGYLGALDKCRLCQRPLATAQGWRLQLARGALVCARHEATEKNYFVVDLGTLLLLGKARNTPLEQLWRLRIRSEMKEPLWNGLLDLTRHQMGKDLKSLRLLRQIAADLA